MSGRLSREVLRKVMRLTTGTLLLVSLICFSGSLLLHIATFFTAELSMDSGFYMLHLFLMATAVPTIGIYSLRNESFQPDALPKITKLPMQILFGYFVINFSLLIVFLEGGSPTIYQGDYALTDHGKLIRFLTETEYKQHRTEELRFFSSAWMICYGLLAAYLWHLWGALKAGFREITFRVENRM